MPRTIRDIPPEGWNGDKHVLVRYEDTQPALWVRDESLAGYATKADEYTVCDEYMSYSVDPDEDLDEIIREWKTNVDWTDEPREEEDDGV